MTSRLGTSGSKSGGKSWVLTELSLPFESFLERFFKGDFRLFKKYAILCAS